MKKRLPTWVSGWHGGLLAASLIYLALSIFILVENTRSTEGAARLLEGDTRQYLQIANDFAQGNFAMGYVAYHPHRQPLYPALLAPVLVLCGKNLFWLGMVNVVGTWLTALLLFFTVKRLSGELAAAVATGCLLIDPFLFVQTTGHLLTEPLHVFWMVLIYFLLMEYLKTGRRSLLPLLGAVTGADYLTRTNGLFVFAALGVVLLLSWLSKSGGNRAREIPALGGFVVLFLLVSLPSLWPRWEFFHDPFHHGYLSNYLWVDSKQVALTGDPMPIYTWHDYVAVHHFGDVWQRWWHGIWKVIFQAPVRTQKVPILFILALGGAISTLWRGTRAQRLLLLCGGIQLLPLIWTNLANPTVRVPWGVFFPLELWLTVFLVETWSRRTRSPASRIA